LTNTTPLIPPLIVVDPELALNVPVPPTAAKLSVPLPPLNVPPIVVVPATVIPKLLVASVSVVELLTVSVPARLSPLVATVTTGVDPVITARFPTCTAVLIVPVPLIWIVLFVAELNGPLTLTLPLAAIVFTAVLATPPVPLLEKFPQSSVPDVFNAPAVRTLNAFAPALTVPPF
jgi:hypothetical protein